MMIEMLAAVASLLKMLSAVASLLEMLAAVASLLEMLAFLMWFLVVLDIGFVVLSGGQAAFGYQCGP